MELSITVGSTFLLENNMLEKHGSDKYHYEANLQKICCYEKQASRRYAQSLIWHYDHYYAIVIM